MYEVRLTEDGNETCLYRHTALHTALESARTTVVFYERKIPFSVIETIYGGGFFTRIGYRLHNGLHSEVCGENLIHLEVKIHKINETTR